MSVNKPMRFDDKGPWSVEAHSSDDKQKIIIQSDDFNHDVWLYLSGDFATIEDKIAYAQGLADILNKHRKENGK